MTAGVLLLGARRGALAAAARLGLAAWVVADALPPGSSPVRGLARPQAPDAEAVFETGRALLGRTRPAIGAVVALTEAAVVPAARLREAFGIGGHSTEVALRCTDKRRMKTVAASAGIPITPWRALDGSSSGEALVEELGLPLVLKLARSSGSRGQVVARDLDSVRAALPQAELAERFVDAREMSVELLVDDGQTVFTNPTEYLVPLHASIVAAPPEPTTWCAAQELVQRVSRAFGLQRGVAHLELYLTPSGPLFGELAVRPPGGRLMPMLRRAYHFDPWEALLELELGRAVAPFPPARRCVGAWMLHPGAGRVRRIEGQEAALAVPGIRRVVVRVAPGERIATRLGSGQDIGYIEAEGEDRDAVARSLIAAHAALRVELEP